MLKKVIGIAAAVMLFAALVPGLNAQTVLLTQDFNGEWTTASPPTGWTIIYTTGPDNNDWHRYAYTGSPGFTGACARLSWTPSETSVGDALRTPQIDCSNSAFASIWVAFNIYYDDYSGAFTAQFRGSADNGATFPNIITSYDAGGSANNYGPMRDSIDISDFALGQNDVRLDFYGAGATFNLDYWYVDNFVVYGIEGGGPGGTDTIDFQMSHILRPYDEEEGNVAFNPTCKVYLYTNIQIDSINGYTADPTWPADVRCRITDLSNMQVVYDKTLSNFPFPEGYTTVSEFPAFTPEGGKNYKALFVVTGAGDSVPDNDNLEKNWSTVVGEDVTPIEIIAPADTQMNAFKPSAKFLEKAGVAEDNVVLHYRIEGTVYYAVYEDSVTHSFAANEEYTAEFPEVAGLTNDNFTVRFWATNKVGVDISHPDLSKPFSYSGIAEKPEAPKFDLSVSGNVVSYTLAKSTSVSLKVYDAAGNLVSVLASGSMPSGSHTAIFDTKPGVYFVKLVTPDYSTVRKVAVIK